MKKNEDDVASEEGIIYRKDQIKETSNCEDYNSPNITQEEIKLEILTQDEEGHYEQDEGNDFDSTNSLDREKIFYPRIFLVEFSYR